jgi:hypothetical protein
MAMAIRAGSPPLDYLVSDMEDDDQDELVFEGVLDALILNRKQWRRWK